MQSNSNKGYKRPITHHSRMKCSFPACPNDPRHVELVDDKLITTCQPHHTNVVNHFAEGNCKYTYKGAI